MHPPRLPRHARPAGRAAHRRGAAGREGVPAGDSQTRRATAARYIDGTPPSHRGAARARLRRGAELGGRATIRRGQDRPASGLALQLVRIPVDVIVGPGSAVDAARHATKTIPIVMGLGLDPVARGFVSSLARPGGNITGVTYSAGPEISQKRLELLKQAVPRATRIAGLAGDDTLQAVRQESLMGGLIPRRRADRRRSPGQRVRPRICHHGG